MESLTANSTKRDTKPIQRPSPTGDKQRADRMGCDYGFKNSCSDLRLFQAPYLGFLVDPIFVKLEEIRRMPTAFIYDVFLSHLISDNMTIQNAYYLGHAKHPMPPELIEDVEGQDFEEKLLTFNQISLNLKNERKEIVEEKLGDVENFHLNMKGMHFKRPPIRLDDLRMIYADYLESWSSKSPEEVEVESVKLLPSTISFYLHQEYKKDFQELVRFVQEYFDTKSFEDHQIVAQLIGWELKREATFWGEKFERTIEEGIRKGKNLDADVLRQFLEKSIVEEYRQLILSSTQLCSAQIIQQEWTALEDTNPLYGIDSDQNIDQAEKAWLKGQFLAQNIPEKTKERIRNLLIKVVAFNALEIGNSCRFYWLAMEIEKHTQMEKEHRKLIEKYPAHRTSHSAPAETGSPATSSAKSEKSSKFSSSTLNSSTTHSSSAQVSKSFSSSSSSFEYPTKGDGGSSSSVCHADEISLD